MGREQQRQQLLGLAPGSPAPEAFAFVVWRRDASGGRGPLAWTLAVSLDGEEYEVAPSGDTSLGVAARSRIQRTRARGKGWQLVLGAALALVGDGVIVDAPYAHASYREARVLADDIASLGGMTVDQVAFARSMGFL